MTKEQSNIANTSTDHPVDLGQYGPGIGKLSQEQMLGIGGGTEFLEIKDSDGACVVHVAMPVLLRDRAEVTHLLKQHAGILLEMKETFENEKGDKQDAVNKKLEELEEKDIKTLLKIAYHTFKRCDPSLKGMTEKEGICILENWMSIPQLHDIPDVAKGMNKLSPLRMGAAMQAITDQMSLLNGK